MTQPNGACREGFDLFSRYGRLYFFRRGILGDRWARKFVLLDTFGKGSTLRRVFKKEEPHD
jgi:hypothetical protein